jgi:protein-S-isoprenylcysteine O-methyltransferase Ste14
MKLVKLLVGSGDRIGSLTLPFLVVGLTLNIWRPSMFSVGALTPAEKTVSAAVLAIGVVVWAWSVALILTRVPKQELITSGPFALVKHPLYTGVSLLVLPWAGLLLGSWLGIALGLVLYTASRMFAPDEEVHLAREFGPAWDDYAGRVALPWL